MILPIRQMLLACFLCLGTLNGWVVRVWYFRRNAIFWRTAMGDEVRVWCDREVDFLEVLFDEREGYFRETENDGVMERVDRDGNIVGFSVLNVSGLSRAKPLSVHLKKQTA